MKLAVPALLSAALTACAPAYAPPPAGPAPGPWYGHGHGPRPHPYPPAPPRHTYVSPDPSDPCGRSPYGWLVGRHRSEILPQRPTQAWRVYSTDMGVTADHHPARLNIEWDHRTGRVVRLYCG